MSGYNRKPRKVGSSRSGGYTGSTPLTGSTRGGVSQPDHRDRGTGNSTNTVGSRGGTPSLDYSDLGLGAIDHITGGNATSQTLSDLFGKGFGLLTDNGANLSSILAMFGNNATNPLIQLLALLNIGQNRDMTNNEAADWNKQLLDRILNYQSELEKRKYNEGMLADQRLYDNPQNQLARLMGSGISRDAAIQMLQEGTAPISGESGAVAEGLAPSESRLNGFNAAATIGGLALSAVNGLAGLINLGFTMAQAKQQVDYMKNENYLTRSQVESYESTGVAYSILHDAGSPKEAFGSLGSAAKALQALADGGNVDAKSFIDSGGLFKMKRNASFSSHTLGNLYKSERSSEDYAREYTATMRKLEADADLSELQFDALTQEIKNAEAEYDQINANTDYLKALQVTTEALGIDYRASAALKNQQTIALGYENQATEALFGSEIEGKSYIEWRNTQVLNNLITDAKIAAKTNNPEYIDAVYSQMFNSAEAVAAAMSLAALKDQAGLDFANKYPVQFQMWTGLEKCHAYEYLDYKVRANTAGRVQLPFGMGSFNTSGENYFDIFGIPKLP